MYLQNFLHKHGISLIILSIFITILGLLFIDSSHFSEKSINKEHLDPFVLCTKGTTIVSSSENTSVTLEVQDKSNLIPGQRIRTNPKSNATVFWADGSISRLGEETEIVINELKNASDESTKVDISLNSGKSWTNTSRILDKDSDFILRYEGGERVAAVRGTIFDINLEKKYIFTESHAIEVFDEKGNKIASIPEGTGLTIPDDTNKKESSITVRDAGDWIRENSQLDDILTKERIKKLQEGLEKLNESSGIQTVQNWLRELFGFEKKIPPYKITVTPNGIQFSMDTEKLSDIDKKNLEQVYSRLTGLGSKIETVQSKQHIQEVLLGYATPEAQQRYKEWFARSELYDSWHLAKELETSGAEITSELKKDKQEIAEKLLRTTREKLDSYSKDEELGGIIQGFEKALPENIQEKLKKNSSNPLESSSEIIEGIGKIGKGFTENLVDTAKDIGSTITE